MITDGFPAQLYADAVPVLSCICRKTYHDIPITETGGICTFARSFDGFIMELERKAETND